MTLAGQGAPSPGGLLDGVRAGLQHFEDRLSTSQTRLLLALIVALSGFNFVAIKMVAVFSPAVIMSLRWILASVALAPWVDLKLDQGKSFALAGMETGFWLASAYSVQQICLAGPHAVPAGVAAFFCSLSSVVCPFLEFLTGSKLDGRAWLAAGLAVVGAAILELGATGVKVAGKSSHLGMSILCWMQPLFFGMYLFRTAAIMRRFPKDALSLTSLQIITLAVVSTIWALAVTPTAALSAVLTTLATNRTGLFGILWIGIVSSAFCHAMQTVIVGHLSSSETAIQFAAEPLWAAAIGCVLLGEGFGWNMYVGGSLAIGACLTRTAPNVFRKDVRERLGQRLSGKPEELEATYVPPMREEDALHAPVRSTDELVGTVEGA